MTLAEAEAALRLDSNTEIDNIITGLLAAVPVYIETVTGMPADKQADYPIIDTLTGFLLRLWYYPEGADTDKIQRVIDSLLKTITIMARS